MKKILVIYYSQTGQTRRIAELLAGKLHADLAEVRTVRVYNDDMWKAYDESQQELREGKLPELKGRLPNVAAYDTVIIGGPVWGQTLSNPILALLRQMDFTGKTVSSFWTFYDHDENYERDMKREVIGAKVVSGLSLPRSITTNRSKLDKILDQWLKLL